MGPEKYLLRWRYEYKDGKPPLYGQWSPGGKEGAARLADQTNLDRAMIEAKDIVKRDVFTLLECDAAEFIKFEWVTLQSVFMGGKIQMGPRRVVGLRILTKYGNMEAFTSGECKIP